MFPEEVALFISTFDPPRAEDMIEELVALRNTVDRIQQQVYAVLDRTAAEDDLRLQGVIAEARAIRGFWIVDTRVVSV